MWRIYLILIPLFVSSKSFAFDILNITAITDHNGLSQNTIRCMMQDSRGFMWMGTINGLNCYNGKEFMLVQPQHGSHLSLPDSRIRSISEDKNNRIWIRTFSNTLYCYDLTLEQMVDYAPENKQKIFTQLMITSDGDIWLWGIRVVAVYVM